MLSLPRHLDPAILALTLGAVAVGFDNFVTIGALNEIRKDLGLPVDQAGWLVAGYALAYAVFAPLNAYLFRSLDRWLLIRLALVLFLTGNLTCALADDFAQLLIGRMISAFGTALFTPIATSLAAELVADERKGMALSLVFGGMTVSQVVGVPITTALAQSFDWRHAFALVVALGVLALMVILALTRGRREGRAASSTGAGAPARWSPIVGLLGVTFLAVLSEFVVYSYVSIVLADTLVFATSALPIVLFVYGIGAVVGNLLTGVLTDRFGPAVNLVGAVALQTGLLVALVLGRDSGGVAVATGFCWGIVSYMYLVPLQHRLLSHAGQSGPLVLSLNSSLIYAGISAGAFLGGLSLEHWPLPALALLTVLTAIPALLGAVLFMRVRPLA